MFFDLRPALAGLAAALVLSACGGLSIPTPTPAAGLSAGQRAPTPGAVQPGQPGAVVEPAAAKDALTRAAAATPAPGAPTVPAGVATPTAPGGTTGATSPAGGSAPAKAAAPAAGEPVKPAPGQAAAAAPPASVAGAPGAPAATVPASAPGAAPTPPSAPGSSAAATPTVPATGSTAPAAPAGVAAPTPATIAGAGNGAGGIAPPTAGAPGCGANAQLFGLYAWNGAHDADQSVLAKARESCATLGQITIPWGVIEFAEGYNDAYFGKSGFDSTAITPIDRRISSLVEAGQQPVLLISEPPAWALVTPGTQGPLKPDKTAKYADFVRRIVQRYGAAPYNVRHVVLWPEPDHRGSLPAGCPANDLHRAWGDVPDQFVQMLRTTYPAVKSARSDVHVIMGAVAYDNWGGANRPAFNSGNCGPFNYTFLDDVLRAGGADYFDVFAFNSYGVFSVGWEQNADGYDVAAKAGYIRSKFPALQSKPFMVLEAGVWSAGTAVPVSMPDGSVGTVQPNDDWQAGYPAKLFSRGIAAGLRGILWYGFRDADGDEQRGLLDRNLQPKKVFHAYKHAVQRLSGAQFIAAANLGSGAEGYVFQRAGGGQMAVVWAVGETNARADVSVSVPGGNLRAYDALGNQVGGVQASGDTARLTVGNSPVYVVSGP